MHPHALLAIKPTSIIADLIKSHDLKSVRVFVDMKNSMKALFIPDVIQEMVMNTETNSTFDSTIAQSVLLYYKRWKAFTESLGVDLHMVVHSDRGESMYHKSILKTYKHSRSITKSGVLSAAQLEQFNDIKYRNSDLIETICKYTPKLDFVYLKFLESDFVPYYYLTRLHKGEDDVLNVIISTDKDMYQILPMKRTIQLFEMGGESRIVSRNTIFYEYAKIRNSDPKRPVELVKDIDPWLISATMAVVGDSSDDVPGIKGIGNLSAIKAVADKENTEKLIGSAGEVHKRIKAGGSFFKDDYNDKYSYGAWDKVFKKCEFETCNEICTTAYKLISYESLCNWLEEQNTEGKRKWLQEMGYREKERLGNSSLYDVFSDFPDCYLTESDCDLIMEPSYA